MAVNEHLGDINKKSNAQLQELLERQEKLLSNTFLLKKLPDKGEKLQQRRDEIKKLLERRKEEIDVTTTLMSSLSISSSEKEQLGDDDIENEMTRNPSVFETLANNEAIGTMKKKIIHPIKEKFYPHLTQEIDNKKFGSTPRLNKPKKTNVKKTKVSTNKYEEESAVRYPVGPHEEAHYLSLNDSLHLQQKYLEQVKAAQTKNATEQLKRNENLRMENYLPDPTMATTYRETTDLDSDLD